MHHVVSIVFRIHIVSIHHLFVIDIKIVRTVLMKPIVNIVRHSRSIDNFTLISPRSFSSTSIITMENSSLHRTSSYHNISHFIDFNLLFLL